ncbi:MAG: MFS transporter [Syntrophomonadaceae bacterium]|jgi:EmrB/QacA subfamily drug resistance transporter
MQQDQDSKSVKRYTLLAATTAAFLAPFMGSAINLAVPSIGQQFNSGTLLLSWVVTSYLLASVAFLVPFGRLADIRGRKKIFTLGITVFSLASVLCGLAWSIEVLIICRAIQGFGSAMIFGTGMAMLTSVFPPQERGRVLGINGAVVYAGLTLGPVLGGALTHNIGWPSIFFLSALIGFAVLGLTLAKLKGEWLGAADESYDLRGAVLYTVGIIAFTYGISTVATSHWARYILGAGIIILIVFARHELKIPSPVLQLRLFRHNAVFSFSLLAALINYCATFAVGFILSLFLQVSLGYNSQVAGFILLAQPIIMALVSPSAGRLSDRIDPRLVASTGMGISTLGLFILIFINPQFPLMVVMLTLVLLGLGTALFASPNNNAVLSAVPKQFLGVASSTLGTARLTGQVISMALVTLILASSTGNVELSPAFSHLFIKAARISFIIFTILSCLGILASLARGKSNNQNQTSA